MKTREIIITAGGTKEPIDDVRYIGNFSSGRLGHALAQEYASHGCHVTLIAPSSVVERFGLPPTVIHEPFITTDDLRTTLHRHKTADILFHAAAVADYTPQKREGKIASDKKQLTVELVRTPKILASLRSHFGSNTTIIGFKLLSAVPKEQLIAAAEQQIIDNDTDLCVANLLDDIDTEQQKRTLYLVDGSTTPLRINGGKITVARGLYNAIQQRKDITK